MAVPPRKALRAGPSSSHASWNPAAEDGDTDLVDSAIRAVAGAAPAPATRTLTSSPDPFGQEGVEVLGSRA